MTTPGLSSVRRARLRGRSGGDRLGLLGRRLGRRGQPTRQQERRGDCTGQAEQPDDEARGLQPARNESWNAVRAEGRDRRRPGRHRPSPAPAHRDPAAPEAPDGEVRRRTPRRRPSRPRRRPRVPPSSRVASLTADPTPARAGGSTSRIDSVAGRRDQAHAEAHHDHLRHDHGRVRRVDADRRDPEERRAEQHQPGGRRRPWCRSAAPSARRPRRRRRCSARPAGSARRSRGCRSRGRTGSTA